MADLHFTLTFIRERAAANDLRVTRHAQEEMVAEAILLDDVLNVIGTGQVLEDYPTHRRGPCCLLYGVDSGGRDVHIVCTSDRSPLIIITVYVPLPPKWVSPTERRPGP